MEGVSDSDALRLTDLALHISNPNLILGAGLGTVLLAVCLYRYFHLRRYSGLKVPLPPGPSGLPIVGSLLHYPTSYPWFKFTEWKHQFGDIVRLHGLGNEIVILNNLECINDLLVKQGHLYAHRPVFTLAMELMGLNRSMAMMSNTKVWQLHRKLAHTAFSQESVKKYYTAQEDISILLNIAIINSPEHFVDHVRLATGRIVMSVTYGISPKVAEEDYIAHAEDTMMMISDVAAPGASIVDIIPALRHIPESTPFFDFHARAKKGRAMMEKMVFTPYEQVKSGLASEKILPPSFVSDLLSWPENAFEDRRMFEDAVIWTAGSMYGAGGETTYATVLNTILAMAFYPDVQQKAHEELDRVVGDRLPTIADQESTPYLNALIKEVLRWHPSLPMSIAHRSERDVVYKGYLIPKDAIVIPNVWAVAREPDSEFPPEKFIPERFLKRTPGVDIPDPNQYVFGFGRRLCPGRYLAENSMYIMIAYLIHCFDIKPPRDDTGKEVPINPTWKTGLTSFPNPFKCDIKPRSEEKVALCRQREAAVSEL
ncbi:cytochrome P450 [Irpex rosettiformis]|uniref:Cytochrome P450 n=1 Tax=Irpex rosettiformis TaxID=378272 RepID=A0ACB8TXR1_9APHY|nr:cytochrome P450 [Irpex rosettiformis]